MDSPQNAVPVGFVIGHLLGAAHGAEIGVAGAVYFYSAFARNFFGHGHPLAIPGVSTGAMGMAQLIEPLAAFVLFAILALNWILPSGRAALSFTETETAFLFPAPLTRRSLIHFKLIRWQLSILIMSLVLSLVGRRWAFLGGNIWTHALGWWLIFSFSNL